MSEKFICPSCKKNISLDGFVGDDTYTCELCEDSYQVVYIAGFTDGIRYEKISKLKDGE